ncbi:DUF3710 domain-containing protein [Pseudoclavibacter albus]|uniref:DUF3710 domain-containing protein n=1 Tax=Pseudoclavibacter albus TaxID=272241 RepID=UPI0030B96B1A
MGLFDIFKTPEEARPKADKLVVPGEEVEELDDTELEEPDFDDSKCAPADRAERGPFDSEEATLEGPMVDLGSLRIPAREGMGLRLEVEEKTKRLVAVALDYRESTVQVQAFASPRSTGLWNRIRVQLAEQVEQQGGSARELETDLGIELETRLPLMAGAPDGAYRAARFIGVDGPRWFLRAVLSGKALHDEDAAREVEELFRSIIVVRGDRPIPPRDLLPIQIPEAMAQQLGK